MKIADIVSREIMEIQKCAQKHFYDYELFILDMNNIEIAMSNWRPVEHVELEIEIKKITF